MTQVCLSCGADNRDTAKFCKACGTALLPPAEARPFESSAWPAPDVVAAAPTPAPLEAAPDDPFAATQFHARRWAGDPAPVPSFAPAVEPTTTPPEAAALYASVEPEPWFLPGKAGAPASPLAAGVPLPRPFGLPASVGNKGGAGAAPASMKAPAAAMNASDAGGVAAATTGANWPGVAAAAAVALMVVALAAWVAWGWGGFGDKAEPRLAATAVKKTAPPVAEVTPGALVAAAPTAAGALPPPLAPSNAVDVSAPPALASTAPVPGGGALVAVPPTAVPAPSRPPSDARLAAVRPAARISLGGSVSPALPTHANEPGATAAPSPAPVTPVMVLPSGPASPQEACSAAGVFGRSACLHEQCAKPAFATHAQCRRWRLERQQEDLQRLYGGS